MNPTPRRRPPRLIFLLNSAQRRLQQWVAIEQERSVRSGLGTPTPAQGGVLFALQKSDGATMGELAQALDLAPSAVSGLVQRMEVLGWVHRRTCLQDARTQRAWLSPEGLAHLPSLRQAVARIQARLTEGFSDTEVHTVARWLQHVQQVGHPTQD